MGLTNLPWGPQNMVITNMTLSRLGTSVTKQGGSGRQPGRLCTAVNRFWTTVGRGYLH